MSDDFGSDDFGSDDFGSDDPTPLPAPTPGQEQAVRRLLADARHEGGMPADVAARLDATLASLSAERRDDGTVGEPAAVVPLRRRRWPAALLAAAAVAAIGWGTTQVVTGGADEESMSAESGGGVPEPATARRDRADGRPAGSLLDRVEQGLEVTLGRHVPLSADVTDAESGDRELGEPEATRERDDLSYALLRRCGPRDTEGLTVVPARYDGRRAVVTVGPGWAGFRPVEVYVCDTADPHRPTRSTLVVR